MAPLPNPNPAQPSTDAPNTDALAAEGVERRFTTDSGETVGVLGISLRLLRGETVALLGPNGSGKSTLLGMLATIDPPESGRVVIAGSAIDRGASRADLVAARARLGVAFQTHALDPLLTVRENLAIAAALFSVPGAPGRIESVMDALRVAGRAGDRVGTLSGGLARRADLARAMLHEPAVLLLDEPTNGLDPEARADLLATLDALRAEPDAPAILHSTHLTEEAAHADRVLIMDAGRIAAEGSPAELRARLGERTLIIEHEDAAGDAEHLEALGLRVISTDARRTIATLPDEHADRAVRTLLGEGRRFRVGPPSLADVYAAIIGRADERPDGTTDGTPDGGTR
jgi:ABC-2 type transport system ATP-binding protein